MSSLPGRRDLMRMPAFAVCAFAVVACVLASGLAEPASAYPQATTSGQVLLRTTVDTRTVAIPVRRNFVGLSLEYRDAFGVERASGVPNHLFARLFQNITDAGNGPPVLRLGGGSADQTWWNPDGKPKPKGIAYDLDPGFVDAVRNFRQRTQMPLILGLNLAQNRPGIAVNWARAAVNGIGRNAIRAFEVGNEPDLYAVRNYYDDVKVRPSGWGFPNFLEEFDLFSRRLKSLRSWLPLAGAVTCCGAWDKHFPSFLEHFHKRLSLATYHHFPFCDKNNDYPINELLGENPIRYGIDRLRPLVNRAGSRGLRFRLTETTPNACKGDPRYAAALWATDWMLALASVRVAGVDFHQMETTPFEIRWMPNPIEPEGGHFEGSVSPLYYAMVLVARATPNGAELLKQATQNQQLPNGANARVWATVDRDDTVRIVAINKTPSGGSFVVRVAGGHRTGSLQRLKGLDLSGREGVTLAGQKVANPSSTGQLVAAEGQPEGTKVIEQVVPGQGSTYRFNVPGHSAALLVIRKVTP